jgi:hypothetical protein
MALYSQPERTRNFIKFIPEQLYRLDYTEVKIDCNYNFPKVPLTVIDFTNTPFFFRQFHMVDRRNYIFRARLLKRDQKRFENVSEISYVPKDCHHKIGWGRVNKPGEPMFYGSLNHITACAEAVVDAEEFNRDGHAMFVVGKWHFESPLKFANIPYSERYFKLFYDTMDYESDNIQLHHVQQRNADMKEKFAEIEYEVLQFFSDAFARFDTEHNYYYMLSNYYADRVFGRLSEFDVPEEIHGIFYPSIALSYQQRNLVLKPDVVDNHLKFVDAMQILMVKNQTGGADFIPLKQFIRANETGDLMWEPRRP